MSSRKCRKESKELQKFLFEEVDEDKYDDFDLSKSKQPAARKQNPEKWRNVEIDFAVDEYDDFDWTKSKPPADRKQDPEKLRNVKTGGVDRKSAKFFEDISNGKVRLLGNRRSEAEEQARVEKYKLLELEYYKGRRCVSERDEYGSSDIRRSATQSQVLDLTRREEKEVASGGKERVASTSTHVRAKTAVVKGSTRDRSGSPRRHGGTARQTASLAPAKKIKANKTPESTIVRKESAVEVEVGIPEGAEKVFSIVYVNLQGLDPINVQELREIERRTQCDAFSLCETWHRPESWFGAARRRIDLLEILDDWECADIPCPCPNISPYCAKHGMALLTRPGLKVTQSEVKMDPRLQIIDHRQLSALIETECGLSIDHLGVHWMSGENTGKERGSFKRLQMKAALKHLKKRPAADVKIIGGDFNINPSWRLWSELLKQCVRNGMVIQSFADLWNCVPNLPPYTRQSEDGNSKSFLDHVLTEHSSNFSCKVTLLTKQEFTLTSDHIQPLLLEIFRNPVGYKPNTKSMDLNPYFDFMCHDCWRGGVRHFDCKLARSADIMRTYLEAKKLKKSYKCALCGLRFASELGLNKHISRHSNNKMYKCPLSPCGRAFPCLALLKKHTWSRHRNIKPYKCSMCDNAFARYRHLVVHTRIHTGEKPYKCNVCSKTFAHSSSVKSHSRIHSGEKPYKCDMCDITFAHSYSLRLHTRIHRGERPYKCNVCSKTFTQSEDLRVHSRIHTGEKPYKCNMCDKAFTKSSTLQRHTLIHTGEKPHKCNMCDKAFITSYSLQKHTRIHTGEKPYECNVCSKTFTRSEDLREHTRIHTGEKPYKCNMCDKAFITSNSLKSHTRTHTGEKPYKCNMCDKAFITSNSLKSHTRTHTGERPYKCNMCDKTFARRNHLADHTRTHTGERPYKCNVCSETFTQGNSLKSHTRTHTGERPYKCNMCDKAFITSNSLKSHTRIHTGERPYKCNVCSETFTQSGNLQRHTRIHSSEKPYK